MITHEARHEIQAAVGESLAMLVEWTSPPDLAAVTEAATRGDRIATLQKALRELKEPALTRLRSEEGVEVTDLGASPQAIVRASPERWRQLAGPGGYLASLTDLRVVPNVTFHALEPQKA